MRNKFLVTFRNRTILLCIPCVSELLAIASCSRHGWARSNSSLFYHAAVRIAKNVALKYANVYNVSGTRLLSRLHKDAQILGARSPGRLNFVRWRLIFVADQYENCFTLPLCRLEF